MPHFANEGKLLEDFIIFLPTFYFLSERSMLCFEQGINRHLWNGNTCSKYRLSSLQRRPHLSCRELETAERQVKIRVLRRKQRHTTAEVWGLSIRIALSHQQGCTLLGKRGHTPSGTQKQAQQPQPPSSTFWTPTRKEKLRGGDSQCSPRGRQEREEE